MSSTDAIATFLERIGIPVIATELPQPTFLPGVTMSSGKVLYDPNKLAYPGDLLHEAGHIAFTPAAERPALSTATTFTLGDDHAAIAWSYAAVLHLGLPPEVLFHDGGYAGNSPAFLRNFADGHYLGVPLLEWVGLTYDPRGRKARTPLYPEMLKWLRD